MVPLLTSQQRQERLALTAGAGGVTFFAAMAGVQALALAVRGLFAWFLSGLRRRSEDAVRSSYYGEPERM